MPRKSIATRNAEQRERQAQLRERNKAARRPTRDDVARIVLFQVITGIHAKENMAAWERIEDGLIEALAEQGFNSRESEMVIEELVARYTSGRGGFRRKTHLAEAELRPDEDVGG